MKKDDTQMNTAFPSCPDEKQYKRKTTQPEAVLGHLVSKGNISSMEAISLFKVTRLSAVIHTLKKAGISIETQPEPHSGGQHARYFLLSTEVATSHLTQLQSRTNTKAA